MTQSTIAVVAPGDMGSAIGQRLVKGGWRVITVLTDRSPRSRELAAGAGITAVDGLAALAGEAEIVLSVMPPAAALDFAQRLAAAAGAARPLFVDLNAIAPATAQAIAAALGARGIDMTMAGSLAGRRAAMTRAPGFMSPVTVWRGWMACVTRPGYSARWTAGLAPPPV